MRQQAEYASKGVQCWAHDVERLGDLLDWIELDKKCETQLVCAFTGYYHLW
jgi:hypothetical protein